MKIRQIRALEGPNLFHHQPVLSMLLDLGDLHGRSSDQMPGFVARLLDALPSLHLHGCSTGKPGGFVARLHRGTYLGHIVEHVALALSVDAGIDVSYGKTVSTDHERVYRVVVRFRNEAGMRYLLEAAVGLVDALIAGTPVRVDEIVATAKRIVARHALGPSTQAIVDAADAREIPWQRISDTGGLIRLGWGANIQWIKTAVSSHTALIAAESAQDKALTKQLLREAQIPVPRGAVVRSADEAVAQMRVLTLPVVIKPLAGNHGRGCTLGVTTLVGAQTAYEHAAAIDKGVLIEEQIQGRDYRILVVGGRVAAASERKPAHVVGNGTWTIAQLIERENLNPLRGVGHLKPLTRIIVDESLISGLHTRDLSLDSVPDDGAEVQLRGTANLSAGGTAVDVTDIVHPDIAAMCIRAASAIALDIAGIDFVSPDVTKADVGAIIEINAGPGLRMHRHPGAGQPRDVGGAIIETLYPAAASARIPLVAVTGTNGKTTVTRMVSHVLAFDGRSVGMACTDGVWIGGRQIVRGDSSGPKSTRVVLADRSVEVAVVEVARGGIARRGLGYDWADVGIVTNVHEDHIGQDGIRSIDDLVRIKGLVAARVRAGGTLVLSADNEPAARMANLGQVRRIGKRIVYFSLHQDNERIRRHLAGRHTAFLLQDGWIVEARGKEPVKKIAAVDALPSTLGGLAQFNVSNALAAVAACRALGVPAEKVAAALADFGRGESNRGRANLYRVRGGYVMLDYGHNAHAYEAIGGLMSGLVGYRKTGVLDMPGDRTDALIVDGALTAARVFDRVILHKPHNARGRRSGEVATLICDAIQASGIDCECISET
ncbi:MAG: cyanophycin synthetase, partial [Burkholderiaceae bacterium]